LFFETKHDQQKKIYFSLVPLSLNKSQPTHTLLLIFLSADGSRWRVGGDAAALMGFALAGFVFFVFFFPPLDLCFIFFIFIIAVDLHFLPCLVLVGSDYSFFVLFLL
jgi:hypothetical protein